MNNQLQNGLLIWLLACAATACVAEPNRTSSAFLPGIAVNSEGSNVFTAGLDGRLIAIDLADGSIRWQSLRQLEALGFVDGKVIAWARVDQCEHCLQVVWLSAVDGQEQRTSKIVTFPDWVSVEPTVGKQFSATVETIGASLILDWKARSSYAGGAHPSSQILAQFNKDASGIFTIDPDGQAIISAQRIQPAGIVPAALRQVRTATYWNCSDWRDVPAVDDVGMVAFDLAVELDGQTLSARRWRLPVGKLDATRQLMQGMNLELQTSPDARYLFVHDGSTKTDARRSPGWQVFSMRTLRRIAAVPYRAGQTCANVTADAVVMLIEKSPPPNRGGSRSRDLVAYATSNGALSWSVKLRGDPQQPHPR
jgi:hypothetical protein